MIIITGALGFIGSKLVHTLNQKGFRKELVVVDDFYKSKKEVNLKDAWILEWIHRDIFLQIFPKIASKVSFVFHLGARTDTTLFDEAVFDELNLNYSKAIWKVCTEHQVPLVYASSAATYGDGKKGFSDNHSIVSSLKPLNPYGQSKQDFDLWALEQAQAPPLWVGLKFFNVYGPGEWHKKRMASVIHHAFRQIRDTDQLKLFRSHKKGIKNGEQKRDFIFVDDVANVMTWFMDQYQAGTSTPDWNGLYNVGTGQARTFLDLAKSSFAAMGKEEQIKFIDTPEDIRETYQYFTEADMTKLQSIGYSQPFTALEDGVKSYWDTLQK